MIFLSNASLLYSEFGLDKWAVSFLCEIGCKEYSRRRAKTTHTDGNFMENLSDNMLHSILIWEGHILFYLLNEGRSISSNFLKIGKKGSVSPSSNLELSERKFRSAGGHVTNRITRRLLINCDIYETNSNSRLNSFEISIPRSLFWRVRSRL